MCFEREINYLDVHQDPFGLPLWLVFCCIHDAACIYKKIPESIYTLYMDHDTQHCLILVNTYSKIMNSAQSDLNALVITLKLHDKVYSYILHIVPPADYSLNVVYLRQMLMPA